jgi:hypothetical protein
VIKQKVQTALKLDGEKTQVTVSLCILNVIMQTNFYLGFDFFSMTRRAVSLRDILNLVDFMKVGLEKLGLNIA